MSDPGTAMPVPARRWYRQLYVWVLTGMVLGAVTGLAVPEVGTSLEALGDTFVGLLTMLLGPISSGWRSSECGVAKPTRGLGLEGRPWRASHLDRRQPMG
jgi:hypothetical protein